MLRNLAGRSASAAKEIKDLIEDSVNKVEEGSRLVNQSGQTLEEIRDSIKKVANIVGDITSASQEQAQGLDQINKAVVELDTTTQQNTALVEESAAAAESMSEQSNELKQLISFFKLDHSDDELDNGHLSAKQPENERRKSQRPWTQSDSTQSPKKLQSVSSISTSKASGSDLNNDGWEEF